MNCLIVLIGRITTTVTGRYVDHLSLTNVTFASSYFSRKVSVRLHQKRWQLLLHSGKSAIIRESNHGSGVSLGGNVHRILLKNEPMFTLN